MDRSRLHPRLVLLALLALLTGAAGASAAPAIISNGVVQLGVNETANLNVEGAPSSGGVSQVGLRFVPTNNDATSPGCACEGWGAADATSGVTGYANIGTDGSTPTNMTVVSSTATESTAVSVVDIGATLRVTHDFHPSPATPNLYEIRVTVRNTSAAPVDARYRRVMDWDIEPTPFNELVTVATGNASQLLFASANGFATANPLAGPSGEPTGAFTDFGPGDSGALFDFGLGALQPGASASFSLFYGGAATEAAALDAVARVNAEVFSLGQPSGETGVVGGPNTFVFAFAGVGGTAILPPPAVAPTLSALTPTSALPGQQVILTGANFGASQGSSSVLVGRTTAAVESWSDTRIVAFVPNVHPGATTVTVRRAGADATQPFTVLAPPQQAPIANLIVTPTPRRNGMTVIFDATLSIDPDTGAGAANPLELGEQQISSGLRATWDFGDGTTSQRNVATHTYSRPGDYTVKLRVTDRSNRTSTITQRVSVRPVVTRVVRVVRGVRRVVTIRRAPVFRPVNIRIPSQIVFDFGSATLRRESRAYLLRVSRVVRRSTRITRVAGYTDSIGSASYNLRLSRQRANTVRAFLSSRGRVRARLLRAVGFGERRPLATNATEIGRQKNRRVVLTVQLRVGTRRI